MRRLTVQNLVDEVRSMIDELNQETIDDVRDILPALNRAQDMAANILARHYEPPLLTNTTISLVAGTQEYDLPEDIFEDRLEMVEALTSGGVYTPVNAISYRDISAYESNSSSSTASPYYYCVIGKKLRLVPTPAGSATSLRAWYLRDPAPLVLEQGTITNLSVASNYIVLDEVGSELTSNQDNLDSYVNIVDGETGIVKVSLQIQSIVGQRVTFKTVPTRTSVLGRTVSTAIPTTVLRDDLISIIGGTPVPFLKKPLANYLVQYAQAELQRKLGGSADMALRVQEDLEKVVEHSWAGRPSTIRVKKRSRVWGVPARRIYS